MEPFRNHDLTEIKLLSDSTLDTIPHTPKSPTPKKISDITRIAVAFEKILPNVTECTRRQEHNQDQITDLYEKLERARVLIGKQDTKINQQDTKLNEMTKKIESLLLRLEAFEIVVEPVENTAEAASSAPPENMYT